MCECHTRIEQGNVITCNVNGNQLIPLPRGNMQYSVMTLLISESEGIGSILFGFFSVELGSQGICRKVVAK